MLKIYRISDGGGNELLKLLSLRGGYAQSDIADAVSAIIENVKSKGDKALFEYCEKFDNTKLTHFELTQEEKTSILKKADSALYETIKRAARNIEEYHRMQLHGGYILEGDGKTLGRIVRPLRRVGVYIPGGTAAYPSTVLMNCIPASVAGVEEIILVTPPKPEGISPAVVAAAQIAGVKRIFTIGGAQSVAALAFGTESVPRVDKIVGPGNIFVTEAKRRVYGVVDIDMIAGPSEVLVIADETANPEYIAADMLSQAEHDVNASAILVTTSEKLAASVDNEIKRQLETLSRNGIASKSIEAYGAAVIAPTLEKCVEYANSVAPEHLEIMTEAPEKLLESVKNAGSVFLGQYTTEPLGDYFAGTNHVLPTNGAARFASPLSCEDFTKKMSYLQYSREAFVREADDVIRFAQSEGLTAHANAVKIRKESMK